MKIIINESQLKLIVENEDKGENLIDLTDVYESGVSPNKWDEIFLHLNKKKGGIYDGYYIDGDVKLYNSDITELKYLVRVGGRLDLRFSQIKSLPMLSYIGNFLDLYGSKIESLPDGLSVGGFLDLGDTPLSEVTTIEELRDTIKVKKSIFL